MSSNSFQILTTHGIEMNIVNNKLVIVWVWVCVCDDDVMVAKKNSLLLEEQMATAYALIN